MKDDDRRSHEAKPDLRSFGRKRGRKLSTRQAELLRETLPGLALDIASPAPSDLIMLFGSPVREVWLEIGFGGAEHMIWQARQNPDVGLIGCEPFEDGIVKALSAIEEGKLGNIRLHADDARPVLRWLPGSCLARVFILFPDPWPKKRHRKRRLLSRDVVLELARVMRRGAELRLATDIGDYARTALHSILESKSFDWLASSPAAWRERPPDWPETRYERKAAEQGRHRYYFRFCRS